MTQKNMTHQKKKSEETRQRLLEAGLKVFSTKGFSATRIEDVAREAGLTRGAFYWHFRYKLELFREIFSDVLDELHAETQALLQSEASPYERLRSFILNIPARLIEDDKFYAFGKLRYKIEWTDELENAVFKPFLAEQEQASNVALAGVIDDGKNSGAFRRELATPVVVDMVNVFILGLAHQVLDGRDAMLQAEDLQDIVKYFLAGISTQR